MTLLVNDPLLGKMGAVPPPAVKKLISWPSMDEIVSAVKAAVSQASRRLELKAGEDQQLKMMISISRLEVGLGGERC